MKHNWEYKPLANVCEVFVDGDWIESKDQSDGGIRLIQTGNVGNGIFLNKTERCKYISENTFCKLNCCEIFEGDILISRLPDPIGRSCILPQLPYRAITAVDVTIVRPKIEILPKLIVHYTKSTRYAQCIDVYTKGTTRKRISRKNLGIIKFPVPPMEVQERIVAELDQINDLIAKNRELLSQLETLAQSLFYDTFGDPISNPKGWDIQNFANVIKLNSGESLSAKNIITGIYPVYGGNGIVGYHNQTNLNGTNIIIGRVGALCGNVRLVKGDIFVTDNAFITNLKTDFNLLFLARLLTILNLRQYANTAAQPVISNSSLKKIPIILPPLSLQNAFAKKVEAIEAQKAKVEAEIAELQTLLDARMDYWFN